MTPINRTTLLAIALSCGLAAFMVARCANATPSECAEPSPLCAAMLEYAGTRIVTDRTPNGDLPQVAVAAMECARVEWWALELGADPALAIVSAWIESKFDRTVVSRAGAMGVMQVMPHYFCPDRTWEGCDGAQAGVAAIVLLVGRYGRERGISYYRAGTVGLTDEESLSKARRRLSLAKRIKRAAFGPPTTENR